TLFRSELAKLPGGVRVVEAEHRLQMLDLRKGLRGPAGHTLCRGVWRDEFWMLCFEPLQLLQGGMELGVGRLGVVEDVVALFVVPDLLTQLAQAVFRGEGRHGRIVRGNTPFWRAG